MKLTKEYIAGFIDGEAYLGIIRKTSSQCTLGYYYKPVIKIAQIEQAGQILFLLKERYEGNISKTRNPKNPNQRPSIMLELMSGIRIKRVLDEVQPFLIVKSKQAEILRQFVNIPSLKIGKFTKEQKLKIDAEKTKLYKQILSLNKRGVAETE